MRTGLNLSLTIQFVPSYWNRVCQATIPAQFCGTIGNLPEDIILGSDLASQGVAINGATYWDFSIRGCDSEAEVIEEAKKMLKQREMSGSLRIERIGYKKGEKPDMY